MEQTTYMYQGTISSLHQKVAELEATIEGYKETLAKVDERKHENFKLYSDLQYAVRYFLESGREDDNFEFSIDEVNTFLTENSIEALKREYRVNFRIEGTVLVEAENEEEAQDIVQELDVAHWSAEIEHFEAESIGVETTF
jgi:hypothetical protein